MFRPIGGPKMNPKAPAFEPGKPWPGQARPAPGANPDAPAFEPGKPWPGAAPRTPAERPALRVRIPDREPASPRAGSTTPPRTQEEWDHLSDALRRHQALPHENPLLERPRRPANPLRPAADERLNAGRIETEITEKKRDKSDMLMFFDNDIPHEAAGKRAPTPGETAALKDFDARRRAYRDPETGEGFGELRNRGEFSGTYDVLPGRDGKTAAPREFRFDRGNTANMEGPSALPPHMRIHSHPDFTLPIPSPQDHRVAARNYAAHGEKNYLVTAQNSVLQFGPGKNGPEYTRLSPIDIKTPPEPPAGAEASPKTAGSENSDEYWNNFQAGQEAGPGHRT